MTNDSQQKSAGFLSFVKTYLGDAAMVVLFAVIALAYFAPADFEGRVLHRGDAIAAIGAGHEASEYKKQTGNDTRWTNSLFAGMPTYQLAPSYKSASVISAAENAYHLWLPDTVWYLFAYLLGFYILLRAFDFRWHLAALGSVMWAFSTYFLLIIAAGHLWKVMALAYLPPMIAGIVLCYRGRYYAGFIVTALFAALEVHANHVQMTYYYLFIIAALIVAYLWKAVREKQMGGFLKASATALAAGIIGVLMNLSNLYHTWQYSQETMRGKSELVKQDTANQTSTGLDRDYITQWSYGIGETWTLLVPNVKGGSNNIQLQENKASMEAPGTDRDIRNFLGQWWQYWGEQPFTAGPVYVGAFVLFLFILGIFIVRGPVKWALLAVTVLTVMLSWGKNFMGLTDLFIDYMPMYAKFRAVSSILVVAEFTIPLLAMLALREVIRVVQGESKLTTKRLCIAGAIAFVLTAGTAMLFAVAPEACFGQLVSTADIAQLQRYVDPSMMGSVVSTLHQMRLPLLTADAQRSALIILVGTAILAAFLLRWIKSERLMVGALVLLSLIDLWTVNKRYLNDAMFTPQTAKMDVVPMTDTDRYILADTTQNYRVVNLASNTFNENLTSYYHKSIGGYHAAKLRRYQELIDYNISSELNSLAQTVYDTQGDLSTVDGDSLFPVLNMLNTRWAIMPLKDNRTLPVLNPSANGYAWFVDEVSYVPNANAEIEALRVVPLKHTAVADARFENLLGQSNPQDSASQVTLTAYQPNEMRYSVSSDKGGIVVFSEIFYPGWTATVDGQSTEIGRVDYVLRALRVAPGTHDVVMTFKPHSVDVTESIAYASASILILVIVAGAVVALWRRKKEKQNLTLQ